MISQFSIFWVVWLVYASGSSRCNKLAWSHRAWREPDMPFRTLRKWHRASLSGRCCSRLCFRFHIFPFKLTYLWHRFRESILHTTKHPIKLNWSDAYAASPEWFNCLIYLLV